MEPAKLDLTPMIDVTFLLLIFFMLASKFKVDEQEVFLKMPKNKGISKSVNEPVEQTRILLQWCKLRGYQLSENPDVGRPVIKVGSPTVGYRLLEVGGKPNYQALVAYLSQQNRLKPHKKELPVIIDAHSKLPWRYVMKTLDTTMAAGIKDVTFAAREKRIN